MMGSVNDDKTFPFFALAFEMYAFCVTRYM